MPIIIARDGSGEPRMASPLTQEQKEQLWSKIVSNWAEDHKDVLRREMEARKGDQG